MLSVLEKLVSLEAGKLAPFYFNLDMYYYYRTWVMHWYYGHGTGGF